MYKTYIADTDELKQALYRLRYQIFTMEQRKYRNSADHATQTLVDAIDPHAEHFCLESDGNLIGSMRWLHGMEHLPRTAQDNLSLARFSKFPSSEFSFCGRLFVMPSHRGTPALLELVRFAFERAQVKGTYFDFIFCNPHLVRMYEALGYRRYRPYFEDPGLGFQVPMVFVVDDVAHLQAIHSPVAHLANSRKSSPEYVDWFNDSFPEYRQFVSPIVVGHDLFASILSRKINDVSIELFAGLNADQVDSLLKMSGHLEVAAQTRIVRKGDLGEELFVILKGIAEARITADGHSKLLGTMGSGDVFGEMSVFTRLPRSADVIAQTDLELIYFDRSMLEKLLVSNPQIGGRVLLNLCRVLSERFQARESCL